MLWLEVMIMLTSYDIDQLCLFDDEMFRECFRGHPECTAELLKVILGMPDLRIIKHKVEKAVRQQNDFSWLPETFVIFICKDDIMGLGKGLYWFRRRNDSGMELDDGSNILFVNGSYEGDDELGRLVRDLQENDSSKITNKVLADRFEEAREDIKVRRDKRMVVTHFDKLMEKSKEEGIAEGLAEGKIESAHNLLKLGKLTNEEIAEVTGLSLDQIEAMAKGA